MGEVELASEVSVTGEENVTGAKGKVKGRAQVIEEMDRDIDGCIKQHDWAFPPRRPVGELFAYFVFKEQPATVSRAHTYIGLRTSSDPGQH